MLLSICGTAAAGLTRRLKSATIITVTKYFLVVVHASCCGSELQVPGISTECIFLRKVHTSSLVPRLHPALQSRVGKMFFPYVIEKLDGAWGRGYIPHCLSQDLRDVVKSS